MQPDDRRTFQRLRLSKPILATIGEGNNALVLDIGLGGAFLEHHGVVEAGQRFNLAYRWQGQNVEFVCQVVHSDVVRSTAGDGRSSVSHSGVRFIEAIGDSAYQLQDLMATFVGKILAAQKANAAGATGESAGATILAKLGEARRMRARGYVSYRLKDGKRWRVTTTTSALQPLDGFTVGTHEDEQEIETLCRAYEVADEEGRGLIRLVAELSVAKEVH